jgi:hypothetical protein
MGPPPRSLTAEANSCFMVRVPHGPNRIQGCGASIAPERGLPSDQLYRTSNNEGHRVAVTLDTKVLIQGCVKTCTRRERAELFSLSLPLPTVTGRSLLFLFNAIETNFLRASSTSEFLHSLGQKRKWPCLNGMSVLPPRADLVSPARHVRFVPKNEPASRERAARGAEPVAPME